MNSKLEIKESFYGKGIFAKENINKDELLASFDGDVYTNESEWDEFLHNHCIQFDINKWRFAKDAIYFNHSCDPNCGISGMFDVVAMFDIPAGTELTWDYEMTEDNEDTDKSSFYFWSMDCKCGSVLCRGRIGTYRNMPKETRLKYKGYISEWLIKKYGY